MKINKNVQWALVVVMLVIAACGGQAPGDNSTGAPSSGALIIQATNEMTLLANAGIFDDFAKEPDGQKVELRTEKGSVELKLEIESISKDSPSAVHAYITADPYWMPGSEVREKKPIMFSLTTLVVDPAKANELGWVDEIAMMDIINAAANGQLTLCSASASQDATALNFYVAALTALKGNGQTLRSHDLEIDSDVIAKMSAFYGAMRKGAYNSDFLRQNLLEERIAGTKNCDAAVLPESAAIALDLGLTSNGLEAMKVFYVSDATSVQIYTIACVDRIAENKMAECIALQKFLIRPEIQARLVGLGFRANDVGYAVPNADPNIFNESWGIRKDEPLTVDLPKDAVIEKAIGAYQMYLRPGSCTVYVLDYSGSMQGNGREQLLTAMKLLLNQDEAERYYLQLSPKDTTYVVVFAGGILAEHTFFGNDPASLYKETDQSELVYDDYNDPDHKSPLNPYDANSLFGKLYYQGLDSATDFYEGAIRGLNYIQGCDPSQLASIILLTDGDQTDNGTNYNSLVEAYNSAARKAPIYTIQLGDAKYAPLNEISSNTGAGQPCDGRGGIDTLARCFRQFKGNN